VPREEIAEAYLAVGRPEVAPAKEENRIVSHVALVLVRSLDDLDMAAATIGGDHLGRALAALEAGCDMVLACNDWQGAIEVAEGLKIGPDPERTARMVRMYGRRAPSFEQLASDATYRSAVAEVSSLMPPPEFGLGDDHVAKGAG